MAVLGLTVAVSLALACMSSAPATFAQTSGENSVPSLHAQPNEQPSPAAGLREQGEANRELEIAPQNGSVPPDKGVAVIPGDKAYKPGQNTAALKREFRPDLSDSGSKKRKKLPYLGVTVQYTLKCYLGQEEHGLEIINVDPNSPAWRAGLEGRRGMGAVGAAAVTAGALLGPLELAVMPLLARAGQLGKDGDLIVAVDDHRVRSQLDLEDELAKLKPGDTMYLTVIRPLPGGAHKTMKIAVKVGEAGQNLAQAGSSGSGASSAPDAENYAY